MFGNCGYRPLFPLQSLGTYPTAPQAGQTTQFILQPGPTGPVFTPAAPIPAGLTPMQQAVLDEAPDLGTPNQPPSTLLDTQFTQGYLRTKIGSRVRVEFLVGENSLQDRRGTLIDVAVDYIVLLESDSDDHILCDMYAIKFVTFYR